MEFQKQSGSNQFKAISRPSSISNWIESKERNTWIVKGESSVEKSSKSSVQEKAPPETDGSWIGWVVCDSNGSLIYVDTQKIERKWNIKSLETKAILEGINSIWSTYIQNCICLEVESDSTEVINAINGASEDLFELKNIVEAISSSSYALDFVVLRHCGRDSNIVAHYIAQRACSSSFASSLFVSSQRFSPLFFYFFIF